MKKIANTPICGVPTPKRQPFCRSDYYCYQSRLKLPQLQLNNYTTSTSNAVGLGMKIILHTHTTLPRKLKGSLQNFQMKIY